MLRKVRNIKATPITEKKSLLMCWKGEFYVIFLATKTKQKKPINETLYKKMK